MFPILIWGGLGASFRGAKPTKAPPWRRDCFKVLLVFKKLEPRFHWRVWDEIYRKVLHTF